MLHHHAYQNIICGTPDGRSDHVMLTFDHKVRRMLKSRGDRGHKEDMEMQKLHKLI